MAELPKTVLVLDVRCLVFEIFPFHGSTERLDSEHDFAVLKEANGAVGLADRDCDGIGGLADRGG